PSCTRYAMRRVSTRVLPDPAPARIASGAASVVTARRCDGFSPPSSSSRTVPNIERRYDKNADGSRGPPAAGGEGDAGPRRRHGCRHAPCPPKRDAAPSSLRVETLRSSRGRTFVPPPPITSSPFGDPVLRPG